jgi:formylglycine-generating enzyme required for sulfatase activity
MLIVEREFELRIEEPYEEDEPFQEEVVVREAGWFRKAVVETRRSTRRVTRTRPETRRTSARFELLPIPAGTFLMGGEREPPVHEVTLTRPFHIGRVPVTQAQWGAVMGTNPSAFPGPDRPVEQVSWDDCRAFLERLNASGEGTFRLPTEAEWEYACRAGGTGRFCFGDDEGELGAHAWYGDNSDGQTQPVGLKLPNAWGLHDIHGNVWEWCQDWWDDYVDGPATDPLAAQPPPLIRARVFRGGCWRGGADFAESAHRGGRGSAYRASILGLRLVFVPAR